MTQEQEIKGILVNFFREGTNGDYLDALNAAIKEIEQVKNCSIPLVSVTEGKSCHVCGTTEYYITDDGHKACKKHRCYLTSGKN